MAHEVTREEGGVDIGSVSLEDAYMAIPDADNPAIVDARKTYRITLISAALFIAAVFIFIL